MRNLKRVLSLALALVMMLGMMVIGANAASTDFADADEITYTEAVGVMSGLGILEGDGTNYNPTDILTREQAAKIVCFMLMGPANAKKLAGTSAFTDVAATRWSAPFIAYCSNLDIIAGNGDDTFDPNGQLTGVAFAKMLLVALGKDAEKQGYVNNKNWATNIAVDAVNAGLDIEGVDLADPVTREQAAQMAFTALTYSPNGGMTYVVNGISFDNLKDAALYGSLLTPAQTPVPTPTIEGSLAQTIFYLDSATAVVEDNGATVAGQKYTTIGSTKYAVETGLDMIGHNVTVYYKTASAEPDAGYTTYAVVDNTTEVAVAGTETAAQLRAALAAVGVTTNLTANSVNGIANGTITPTSNAAITLGTTTGATFGASTILVANKAIIGVVSPTTYTADKVTAIGTTAGSETITLNSGATLNNNKTSDVVNEYEGIAVGDYVLVTNCGAVYNLAKVQTVEGKITKIATNKVTIDGKDYDLSSITDNSGIVDDTKDFTNTFKLYLDATGTKYFAIKKVTSTAVSSDIIYVVNDYDITENDAYGVSTVYTYAQIIDLNGVESNILVGVKKTGSSQQGVADGSVAVGFATYALSSTPADAKLGIQTVSAAPTSYNATTAPVFADTLKDSTDVTVRTASLEGDNTAKAYVNSATKYIFVNGTGAALKTEVVTGGVNTTIGDAAKMLLTKDADGNYIVKAIIAGTTYTNAGVTASDYLYITAQASPAQTAKGYEYTVYNAATGAKSTVTATNTSVANAGFYSYSVADGIYTFGSKVSEATAPAAGVYYTEAYGSKYGTKITTTQMTDVEAGSAVVVDLRTAATVASDGVGVITSLDTINSLKLAATPKTVTFDCIVDASGVVAIFVTSVS